MCGRYNFTVEQSEEIQEILEKLNKKFQGSQIKTGEIFPTDRVPILIAENKNVSPVPSNWGFPKFDGNGVVINARSDTVFEKKMFRESIISRRCIVPASGFFEWNSAKEKIYFTPQSENIMYMAGIFNFYENVTRFVILTTKANSSIEDVHDRMPLLLTADQLEQWVFDSMRTSTILKQMPYLLNRKSDFEQQNLKLF